MNTLRLKSINKPEQTRTNPIVQPETPIERNNNESATIDRDVGTTLAALSNKPIAEVSRNSQRLSLKTVSKSQKPNTSSQTSSSLSIDAKNYLRSLAQYFPAITYYRLGSSYAHGGIDTKLSHFGFGHQRPPTLAQAKRYLEGNPKYAHMFMPFCSACELSEDKMFAFKNINGVFFDSNLEEIPESNFKNCLIELIQILLEDINAKDSKNQEVDMNTLPVLIDQAVQEANKLTNSSVELHTGSLFRLANLGLFYFSHFNTNSLRNRENNRPQFLVTDYHDRDYTFFYNNGSSKTWGFSNESVPGLEPFTNKATLEKFDNLASQLVSGDTTDPKIVLLNLPDFDIPEQYRNKLQEGVNKLKSNIENRTTNQDSSSKHAFTPNQYSTYEEIGLI